MSRQLPTDCLNEIFEYLEEDRIALHSCLLANRLYCEIAVGILWRNVWDFENNDKPHVSLSIISTLIACLPKESKDLLYKNGVFIITPTQTPPLFNYASFCKVILINEIDEMIHTLFTQQPKPSTSSRSLNYNKYLLSQEILKMFMNQISSLKTLDYPSGYSNIMFTCLPEAKICLTDLVELKCNSDIYSEFFYQISQICHNIKSLTIEFDDTIFSDGLTDLISLQNHLKSVTLISSYYDYKNNEITIKDIIPSLIKSSLTLTELTLIEYYIPLSTIAIFTNLQELLFHFEYNTFDDFNQLQYVNFSQLKILKFKYLVPKIEMLINFLEINGKNLTEFYVSKHSSSNSLNLAIAKFCPNLKILSTISKEAELETLKLILNNCQYLEVIRVWYGDGYLNGKAFFKVLTKYSQKNFYELSIDCSRILLKMVCEEIEEFFINWKNRIPQKLLSLTIITRNDNLKNLEVNDKKIWK